MSVLCLIIQVLSFFVNTQSQTLNSLNGVTEKGIDLMKKTVYFHLILTSTL